MARLTNVLALTALAACSKTPPSPSPPSPPSPPPSTTSPPSPPSSERTATTKCDEIFAAPPSGELLCDEHVVPTSGVKDEIHWRSYGLPEERTVYCNHYLDAARACQFGFFFKPPRCDVTDNKNRRAELFFKTATEMGGADYPRCAHAPEAKHKTVLVISEKSAP